MITKKSPGIAPGQGRGPELRQWFKGTKDTWEHLAPFWKGDGAVLG